MIGANSVDRHTNTPEDAGAFERLRGGSYGYRDDVPDAGDLAADAAMDAANARRRAEREAAARARGEYVPSPAMSLAASACSISLAQRGVFGMEVEPAREGVLRVSPERLAQRPGADEVLAALAGIYGDDAEVVMGNGCVWVRIIRTAFADPFVVDGEAQDNPPF